MHWHEKEIRKLVRFHLAGSGIYGNNNRDSVESMSPGMDTNYNNKTISSENGKLGEIDRNDTIADE